MEEDRRLYWIWMAETFRQGSVLAAKLIRRFETAQAVFAGAAAALKPDADFREEEVAKCKTVLRAPDLSRAEEILARAESLGMTILTPEDDAFPPPLRTLRDMPMVLYVRGHLPDCANNMLTTIVGTRKMTDYGRTTAYGLGAGLGFGGAVVVSGMALGADSMALLGALDAGAPVVAVLGCGADVVYPKEHERLYSMILRYGAIISEYPPGSPPIGGHFPVRNRLMSGMSDAVVVVEGDAASGAMITARCAMEQGIKLFAVPGNVGSPTAEGTNLLLREGAIPALCAEDILCEFEFMYQERLRLEYAHRCTARADMDLLSQTAMNRMRIGTGTGKTGAVRNYYGNGSYGGRAAEVEPQLRRQQEKEKKPAAEETEETDRKTKTGKRKKSFGSLLSSLAGGGDDKNTKTGQPENPAQNRETGTVPESFSEKSDKKSIPAKKIELDMLDENEIKVYNKMKSNVPVLPDELVDTGTGISEVMSALTILEMAGAVDSDGGGYFVRTTPDDPTQSIND